MATLIDLPGALDLVLYVGRPVTITMTFPATVEGRTFTCSIDTTGTPIAPTVTVLTNTLSFSLTAAQLPGEYLGVFVLTETTGAVSVPYMAGSVKVTRNAGTQTTALTVDINPTDTVTVMVGYGPAIPKFANATARDAALLAPTSGDRAWLTAGSVNGYQDTVYDGTGWIMMAEPVQGGWVPTPANLSGGSQIAWYRRSNGRCMIGWKYTLAGAGMGTGPTFALPIAASASLDFSAKVPVELWDVSATTGYLGWASVSGSTVSLYAASAAGAVVVQTPISATVPFTWASGDIISTTFEYEMTSKYS